MYHITALILCTAATVAAFAYQIQNEDAIKPNPFPETYHCVLMVSDNTTGELLNNGRFWYDYENGKQRVDLKHSSYMTSIIWRYDEVCGATEVLIVVSTPSTSFIRIHMQKTAQKSHFLTK